MRNRIWRIGRALEGKALKAAYVDNFGLQWNLFEKTQLDSYTGIPLSRDRLIRCCGPQLFGSLRGKHVLEAGCGAGRFTEVLLDQGAYVTSVDLSSAVYANARNFPQGHNHGIARADILNLPLRREQFDVVLGLGVIQHTPNSEQAISRLYDQVKPGGWLVLDHYTHERRWANLKPLYRAWLKRMPQERVMPTIERMVDSILPLHRALRNFYPGWFALCRVSPLTTFYRSLPELPEKLQREFAMLDTHDSLTDWYKSIRSVGQIRGCLLSVGATNISCEIAGNGVEARCQRKPN